MNNRPTDSPSDPNSHRAQTSAMARDLRILAGKLARRLREQTPPADLTWSQLEVLGHLERDGPTTVSKLARAEDVRVQSMGATVATLETKALIIGTPHSTDGRQIILSLTDAGADLIKQNRAAREDWLSRAMETSLTPSDQDLLASAVDVLKRLIDT
ncbi:MarR family transcriptional regulator [Agrobacterium vitis]|uniref:MarR family transcriptional regulator n=1 Tax=Agrobacterium vitis TaxID=373 RepID=A0A6L6VI59_AGRVI|nr:MarR family transcriptional regulator [Agrobacterium vitis]MUZ75286.1 MarR family transcriptional regulator [Agrobacterium vitis]